MNLFRIAVARPVATTMAFLAIMVFGLFSFTRLPVDLFPEIENPAITVITMYPGAGALEVEQNVTEHLEAALSSVPNLDQITSNSVDNVSTITLAFTYGINLDEASNDIRDVIGRTAQLLPEDADDPIIYKFSSSAIPVIVYYATAEQSFYDLERIIDDQIVGPLNRINGVAAVSLTGAPQRQVDVIIDPQRFEAYNLDLQQVAQILRAENVVSPAGQVDLGENSFNLRVNSQFQSLEDVGNVVLASRQGGVVHLRDVATIREGLEDESAISRINGRQGVTLMVQKQTDANTVQVAEAVQARMPALTQGLPADVEIGVVFDTSEFIVSSIDNLTNVLFYAILFVVLVVLVFLRQWRATLIVAATIPFSLVVAFIYLALTGSTLNIISLSSLAIALGMVVDDAIVVLENIMKQVEKGSKPKQAAIYGTSEVGTAVIATTLTVVAVFLPLTFLTGMTGIWFRELGFIVVVTVVTSTLAALTLTPMMASLLLKRVDEGKQPPKFLRGASNGIDRSLSAIERIYGRTLRAALARRKTVVAAAGGIFLGSLFLTPFLGTEFMPVSDNARLEANVELATGRSLEYTAGVVRQIEERVAAEVPELVLVSSTTGSSGGMWGSASGDNQAVVRMQVTPKTERSRSVFEIGDQVRAIIADVPEVVTYSVGTGGGMGNADPVSIHILGNDIDQTTALAHGLADHMETVEGVRDVKISRGDSRPELEFVFDRDRLAAFGLNSGGVASTVRGMVAGLTATQYRTGGDEFDVVLRYDETFRQSLAQIENIAIMTPAGQQVRVRDLGTVREYYAPPNIERMDRERVVTVSSALMGRPLNQVMGDIRSYVDQMEVPPQIEVVFGGDFEDQQDAFGDMFLILMLSILLTYLVMAAQFESLREPFIIMFSIPFAFTGVILAMLLTNTKLGVIGLLGAIILVGIVVKNAIVLIDYVKLLRARGVPIVEAIVQGGISRLRPVLMTTLTTILAMLPLALSVGEGAETWQPMAIAVIGGLAFSTLVTLVLVPVIYALFERKDVRKSFAPASGDGVGASADVPRLVPVH